MLPIIVCISLFATICILTGILKKIFYHQEKQNRKHIKTRSAYSELYRYDESDNYIESAWKEMIKDPR